ncbi:hypothetical protein HY990_06985 [Candidatus Micrarchaeota archaeon]|nr:hypothetical protein [Candidatus Micrarchaeota archaeon]
MRERPPSTTRIEQLAHTEIDGILRFIRQHSSEPIRNEGALRQETLRAVYGFERDHPNATRDEVRTFTVSSFFGAAGMINFQDGGTSEQRGALLRVEASYYQHIYPTHFPHGIPRDVLAGFVTDARDSHVSMESRLGVVSSSLRDYVLSNLGGQSSIARVPVRTVSGLAAYEQALVRERNFEPAFAHEVAVGVESLVRAELQRQHAPPAQLNRRVDTVMTSAASSISPSGTGSTTDPLVHSAAGEYLLLTAASVRDAHYTASMRDSFDQWASALTLGRNSIAYVYSFQYRDQTYQIGYSRPINQINELLSLMSSAEQPEEHVSFGVRGPDGNIMTREQLRFFAQRFLIDYAAQGVGSLVNSVATSLLWNREPLTPDRSASLANQMPPQTLTIVRNVPLTMSSVTGPIVRSPTTDEWDAELARLRQGYVPADADTERASRRLNMITFQFNGHQYTIASYDVLSNVNQLSAALDDLSTNRVPRAPTRRPMTMREAAEARAESENALIPRTYIAIAEDGRMVNDIGLGILAAQIRRGLYQTDANNYPLIAIDFNRIETSTSQVPITEVVQVRPSQTVYAYSFFFGGTPYQMVTYTPINSYQQLLALLDRVTNSTLPPDQTLAQNGIMVRRSERSMAAPDSVSFLRTLRLSLPPAPSPMIAIRRNEGGDLLWSEQVLTRPGS